MIGQLALAYPRTPELVTRRGTILDRVLAMLEAQEWVTTDEFLEQPGLYTYRNRTSEVNRWARSLGLPDPIVCEEYQPGKWRFKLMWRVR